MKLPEFTMERARNFALGAIAVLNVIATVVSFGESYFGLYRWAAEHGVSGFWGGVWPMMVDLIILVAEAGLFVAHHDKWHWRHKAWLWFVMFIALGVSTSANTGHVHSTDWLSHLTAALAPVALMFATTVGFGVMKRTFMHKQASAPVIGPARQPSPDEVTEVRERLERTTERAHVGTAPWISNPGLAASHLAASQPLTETSQEAAETPALTETPETVIEPERPAPVVPEASERALTETLVKMGFQATEKSYTMPRDPRTEITLPEKRVRDMYDVDPDISANAISKALGIAWATADKYLKATKEARGVA